VVMVVMVVVVMVVVVQRDQPIVPARCFRASVHESLPKPPVCLPD
jgi:hypothetical protein